MKLRKYQCDRCGLVFDNLSELQGVSPRCVERVWDLCPKCLKEFIEDFMGE